MDFQNTNKEEGFIPNNKVIILTWPSWSWKTTVQNILTKDYGFKTPINFSTRNARNDDELDNYVFLTKDQFIRKIENWDFSEYTYYNWNYYWMSKYFDLSAPNICVLEPVGKVAMEKFLKLNNIPYYSIFLKIDEETMEYRLGELRRESVKTIEERKKDLKYFSPVGFDLTLDGKSSIEEIIKTILFITDTTYDVK